MKKINEIILSRYAATIIAFIVTIIYLFPVFWMFITSIKPISEIFSDPPSLFPVNPTFEAYVINFMENKEIFAYLSNSFIIAFGTTLFTLLLAAPASYALARLNIKGKGIILIIMLGMQLLPNIMLALPLFMMYSKIGLINTYLGLIIANTTHSLPFAILVLRPYFLSLPKGLEEAAYIDGSNKLGAYTKVILPLVIPGLLTVGAISFLWGWGDFVFALTLTSNEKVWPLTMGLSKFTGEFGTQWNHLMAVAVITAIPIIIIFISLQKYIVSGLASGSIKE